MSVRASKCVTNQIAPAKSSVYDRQYAKLQIARNQAETARNLEVQRQKQEEMIECTYKPRINKNVDVASSFQQRNNLFQLEKQRKFLLEQEKQQQNQPHYTFQPSINAASEYLAETAKLRKTQPFAKYQQEQKRNSMSPSDKLDFSSQSNLHQSDLIIQNQPSRGNGKSLTSGPLAGSDRTSTEQNAMNLDPECTFHPRISKLAQRIQKPHDYYKILSAPNVSKIYQFEDTTKAEKTQEMQQLSNEQKKLSGREQQLLSDKLYGEYATFLKNRENLQEQDVKNNLSCKLTEEERLSRDLLAYKARSRQYDKILYNKQSTRDKMKNDEECTFKPNIDEFSKQLTKSQKPLIERYDEEIDEMRKRQFYNEQLVRQRKEAEDAPFAIKTRILSDQEQAEFFMRQQDLLDKKEQNEYLAQEKKRKEQIDEETQFQKLQQYKLINSPPPPEFKQNLILLDEKERNEFAEELAAGNMSKYKQQLELTRGQPVLAAYFQDSVAKHVEQTRKGWAERMKKEEALKLRE